MQEFGGRVRFVSENYGDSALAKRFGVTRYPAIFVDDILAATPDDFGFFARGSHATGGRYAPLKDPATHERFRADMVRMIGLVLEGRKDEARAGAAAAPAAALRAFPDVTLTDLDGREVAPADLAGRPILVEIWATWCPPCRGTLTWLGGLKKKHGDRIAVLALAIQSEEKDVRAIARDLALPVTVAVPRSEVVSAFGNVSAVPTLFLFDSAGRTAGTWFGAPPTLHDDAEAALAALLATPAS